MPDPKSPNAYRFARELISLAAMPLRYAMLRGATSPARNVPLMVLPGFLASDLSTATLRKALRLAGYDVAGWGMGLNRGVRPDTLDRIVDRLETHAAGRKVMLVGWSLGGIYAREVAKHRPDLVAKVVTLGSPFSGDPRRNNVWRFYEWINRHPVDNPPIEADLAAKPPVPTMALWSRRDGIVAPACTRGGAGECDRSFEVDCTHIGFATNPKAFRAILSALEE